VFSGDGFDMLVRMYVKVGHTIEKCLGTERKYLEIYKGGNQMLLNSVMQTKYQDGNQDLYILIPNPGNGLGNAYSYLNMRRSFKEAYLKPQINIDAIKNQPRSHKYSTTSRQHVSSPLGKERRWFGIRKMQDEAIQNFVNALKSISGKA
jgi:hypothetical protein